MIPIVVEALGATIQASESFMSHHGAALVRQARMAG
jgi:hypothetical protein